MPIGGAAIIGSAVIGGAAQMSAASKNAKAAKANAAQTSQQINQTQGRNDALYAPFVERGNAAGDALNAFLGLPTSGSSPQAQSQQQWGAYGDQNPDVLAAMQQEIANPKSQLYGLGLDDALKWHYQNHGQAEGRQLPTAAAPSTPATTAANSKQAFDNYLNSTGYQFTANAGRDTINSSKATGGLLNSGSTLKALEKFSAGNAQQYTQNYINNLAGQQGVGLNAASGNAGSNSNILGANTANNSNVLGAQVASNATTANVLSNIANQAASAYAGTRGSSSYGTGRAPNVDPTWQEWMGS